MVLLSFSFVACHNPRFALRDTVHDLSPVLYMCVVLSLAAYAAHLFSH